MRYASWWQIWNNEVRELVAEPFSNDLEFSYLGIHLLIYLAADILVV